MSSVVVVVWYGFLNNDSRFTGRFQEAVGQKKQQVAAYQML